MKPEKPGDVGERIRVAAVDKVFVIDRERRFKGNLRRGAPFNNLLSPVHAHVVMHVSRVFHLVHRGVPVRVVGLRVLELPASVDEGPAVGGVCRERPPRPGRHTAVAVVIGREIDKVERQLAPDNDLIEVALAVLNASAPCREDLPGNVCRRYLPEMQVGAHMGDIVSFGPHAVRGVTRQPGPDEKVETPFRLARAAGKSRDRFHSRVDRKAFKHRTSILNIQALDHHGPQRERGDRRARLPETNFKEPQHFRPESAGARLVFIRSKADRDNDIAFNLLDRAPGPARDCGTPLLLVAGVPGVAHYRGSAPADRKGDIGRRSLPDSKRNAPPREVASGLGQPFQHEGVMAQVGVGIIAGQAKTDGHGKAKGIGLAHGILEGVVLPGPLALLHPVKDEITGDSLPAVQVPDALRPDIVHGDFKGIVHVTI